MRSFRLGLFVVAALLAAACGSDGASSSTDAGATTTDASADAGSSTSGDTDASDADAAGGAGGACVAPEGACERFDPSLQPPRLSEFASAYVEADTAMYVFGGSTAVPPPGERPAAQFTDALWRFDDACGAWEAIDAAGPSARGRAMATDAPEGFYVFGGRWRADGTSSGDYTLYDELWFYELATRSWSLLDSGGGPSARVDGVLEYDAAGNQILLFAGNESASGLAYVPLQDTWAFDLDEGSWSRVNTSGPTPAPRLFVAGTFDTQRRQLVVGGGGNETAFFEPNYFGDLYALDVATGTWEQLANAVAGPEPRFWGKLAYDPVFDSYVLFAGHDGTDLGNRNDLWEWRAGEGAWSLLSIGDTFQTPANGPNDFPPDFALVDTAMPERRSAHGFVWSETCGHGIAFGGKTDCGAVNDVWRVVDGVFVEAVEATSGEVCHRFRANPDNCVNLCF